MRVRDFVLLSAGAASAAMLVYGALYEANNLVLEERRLPLPGWPERLVGYRIALIADLHLRDRYSLELAQRAVAMALDARPDMVCLLGDYVGYWKPESARMLGECLEPLLLMEGKAVAVAGNHEYWGGDPSLLVPIFDELNIHFLRNEMWKADGIQWIGMDSETMGQADPNLAFDKIEEGPRIVLWHEPDAVERLPQGSASLMLSGHSHGGQFRFPGGFTPMHTRNGRRYVRGFYPEAPVPIYVSRGVGTTGPPSRFNCPPEVSLLTLG
jgi:uncharacterized protein